MSLATIYNTLHQFTAAGLLREVVVSPGRSYFDTNVEDHHHFFYESNGSLEDIPGDRIVVKDLPARRRGRGSAASTSSSASIRQLTCPRNPGSLERILSALTLGAACPRVHHSSVTNSQRRKVLWRASKARRPKKI